MTLLEWVEANPLLTVLLSYVVINYVRVALDCWHKRR